MKNSDAITSVGWTQKDQGVGTVTVAYSDGTPPRQRPGSAWDCERLAAGAFGHDRTRVDVFTGHEWVRGR